MISNHSHYIACRECAEEMVGILHPMVRDTCYECGGHAKRGWAVDKVGGVHPIGDAA